MNNRLLHIIEWLVAIAAYAWLGYQLATYEHYDIVASSLRAMGTWQWIALALCIALMPVNMALEAWRWQTLMANGRMANGESSGRMSFHEAQRQVYYSKLAGLITPWRLGEYPARALLMKQSSGNDRSSVGNVLSMGAVGSATMTIAIVLAGVIALVFSPQVLAYVGDSYLYALVVLIAVMAVCVALAPKALKRWADFNHILLWISIAQSIVRLACWCVQLALVLYALNAFDGFALSPSRLLTLTPVYYLLVTITPNIPIVEAGVRGAWAMMLFGTVNAALAGVLLWGINTLLPCAVWIFFKKNAE